MSNINELVLEFFDHEHALLLSTRGAITGFGIGGYEGAKLGANLGSVIGHSIDSVKKNPGTAAGKAAAIIGGGIGAKFLHDRWKAKNKTD